MCVATHEDECWYVDCYATSLSTLCGFTPAFLNCPSSGFVRAFSFVSMKPSLSAEYPSFATVLTCTTGQGPASTTVTGIMVPSAAKSWVIPTLRPMIALFIDKVHSLKNLFSNTFEKYFSAKYVFKSELDLDVHACGEVNGIEKFRVGRVDVDDSLIRSHLELLAGILVLMRGTKDRDDLPLRGKGNGTGDFRSALFHRLHDTARSFVHEFVIVRRQLDSDFLNCHFAFSFYRLY